MSPSRASARTEEHIAQKIVGHGLVADEPEQPTIEVSALPGEQHLHGKLVARRDALQASRARRSSGTLEYNLQGRFCA